MLDLPQKQKENASARIERRLLPLIFLGALFTVLYSGGLLEDAGYARLNSDTVTTEEFRSQELTEENVRELAGLHAEKRGEEAGLAFLEGRAAGNGAASGRLRPEKLRRQRWMENPCWSEYVSICDAIWKDVVYFPVPMSERHKEYTVNYVDSWMAERTYGGKRGHEGCDLMAAKDKPGLYPVVSMTDGVVESMGWLEKGGYRIGILAPSGGYFYYAHLDSYAALHEGEKVDAGQLLGFMGNSGYGPEGTKGMFATHLHVGIYVYPDGTETSVNPYWILRMIEEKKLSCSF